MYELFSLIKSCRLYTIFLIKSFGHLHMSQSVLFLATVYIPEHYNHFRDQSNQNARDLYEGVYGKNEGCEVEVCLRKGQKAR